MVTVKTACRGLRTVHSLSIEKKNDINQDRLARRGEPRNYPRRNADIEIDGKRGGEEANIASWKKRWLWEEGYTHISKRGAV